MQMEQILPAVLQRKVPAGAEEIRLRSGCRPLAMVDGRAVWLDEGRLTPAQIKEVVDRACRYSIHSYQDQLAQGYLTIQGGHRMGVCGQAVMQQGRVQMMRNFSSVNLRVARQIVGAAAPVYPLCFDGAAPLSVLLFSPPGYGKTTLLRDLIRRFSLAGWRVGVADERAEICAMVQGQSQFDLGEQVDVITGCPKALGAMMLLKTMSPQILAVDEITSPEDVQAQRGGQLRRAGAGHHPRLELGGAAAQTALYSAGAGAVFRPGDRHPAPGQPAYLCQPALGGAGMRGIGALLVLAAGFWLGSQRAAALRRRAEQLGQVLAMLDILAGEIVFRGVPLQEALERSAQGRGAVGEMFLLAARRLETDGLRLAWREALGWAAEHTALQAEDLRPLEPLGDTLGQYDGETQAGQVKQACALLERQRLSAQQEWKNKGRVYRASSLTMGAIVALALMG